ncbi:hypothetical protein EfmAA242_18400 [Enterococcus faecium]|nr:hypothetical protein EfmAA242_18400 [Enterococcus faecium]
MTNATEYVQAIGSYTGLRIGVTTAKTIAYTLDKELVGVSSLKTIAANCIGVDNIIVPMFDARRKNVYAGAYRWKENRLETVLEDVHISASDLQKGARRYAKKKKFRENGNYSCSDLCNSCYFSYCSCDEGIKRKLSTHSVAQLGALVEPVAEKQAFLPRYLKRVEAEEKWLSQNKI